jgi:hypothetical protein
MIGSSHYSGPEAIKSMPEAEIGKAVCQRRLKTRPYGDGIAVQFSAVFLSYNRFFVWPGGITSSSRPALSTADARSGGQGGPKGIA